MEWISQTWDFSLARLSLLARLAAIFGVLAWLMPCNRGMFWWKNWRATATDFLYWFATPIMVRGLYTLALSAGLVYLLGGTTGFDALGQLPLETQCIMILVIQDFMLYWIHRGFHTRGAWSFHAVHHSPKSLDWLAAGRFHLVNYVVSFVIVDAVALLLGFSSDALMKLIPLNVFYSAMVHANLNWTFGPLRFLFASPVFHRWHHVAEGEGIDKNFSSTFPVFDLLFGTFYMPKGEIPQNFGNGEADYPEGFLGQFLRPFWKKKPVAGLPAEEPRVISMPEENRSTGKAA